MTKAASPGEVRPRSDLQHLGHRRAGQDEAPLEVVHTRHGRDHLRRGLERQGEVGGGQVGVAADQQVEREAKMKTGKYKKCNRLTERQAVPVLVLANKQDLPTAVDLPGLEKGEIVGNS